MTKTEDEETIINRPDRSTYPHRKSVLTSGATLYSGVVPNHYREFAVFGDVTYYITPKFDLGAGLRYSDTQTRLGFLTDGPLLGGFSNAQYPDGNANPKGYLFTTRYRPNNDLSLYARVANGYRPVSSVIPVSDPFTGELLSQTQVDPDSLWSYEIGAKGAAADGRLDYDLSLWYIDWRNFQSAVSYYGIGTQGNARDGITVKGFEASAALHSFEGLTFTSGISYADSTLNADEPALNGLRGQSTPGVPKWTVSVRSNYEFNVSSGLSGDAGIGLRYTQGSPSAFFGYDLDSSDINIPSDSYVLVDAVFGIRRGGASLRFYANNMFNKFAISQASGYVVPGTEIFGGGANIVRPRTVGMILSYEF